jgi:hypothetical protein
MLGRGCNRSPEYSNKAAKAHRRVTRNAIEDVGVAKSGGWGLGQNCSDRGKKSQWMTDSDGN